MDNNGNIYKITVADVVEVLKVASVLIVSMFTVLMVSLWV